MSDEEEVLMELYRRKHDFWKIKKVYTVSLGRDPGQLKKQKMQK